MPDVSNATRQGRVYGEVGEDWEGEAYQVEKAVIPLKWLLILSGVMAALALLIPLSLFLAGQFGLLDSAQRWAVACAWLSVGLLVLGLFMHRWRALWLVIPVLVAFAFPFFIAMSIAIGIDECVQQHRQTHQEPDTCFP